MNRDECLLALYLACQERRPIKLTMSSGYIYYGAIQALGQTNGLPEGGFRLLMLDSDGEAQATVELSADDVQQIIPDEPEACRRLKLYICAARGYVPGVRSIRRVVQQLRARPGLYLGSASVQRLRQYLAGYMAACTDADPLWQDEFAGNAFSAFVSHEYGQQLSGRDWAGMICERYPDDGSAFDEFLRLFDLFCSE